MAPGFDVIWNAISVCKEVGKKLKNTGLKRERQEKKSLKASK